MFEIEMSSVAVEILIWREAENILNIESFCLLLTWSSSQMLFLPFPPWSSPSPLLYILSGCQAFCSFLTAWYKPHLYSQAWSFSSSQWPLLLGLL